MAGVRPKHVIAALIPAALLAGCGSPEHHTARVLQQRLQMQLAQDVAAHRAVIQPTQDGAVVGLDESVLFAPNETELDPSGRYTVASVAESLLDPRLMQVDVEGSKDATDLLRDARAENVRQFVQSYSLGPGLAVAAPQASVTGPSAHAMTITIQVHCPPGPQGSTWKYQVAGPTCN